MLPTSSVSERSIHHRRRRGQTSKKIITVRRARPRLMRCDRCTVWGNNEEETVGRTDPGESYVTSHDSCCSLLSCVGIIAFHVVTPRHLPAAVTMQSSTRSDSVCSAAAAPRDAGSELLLYTIGLFHFQYSQLTIIHLELLSPVCVLFLFAFQSVYL